MFLYLFLLLKCFGMLHEKQFTNEMNKPTNKFITVSCLKHYLVERQNERIINKEVKKLLGAKGTEM